MSEKPNLAKCANKVAPQPTASKGPSPAHHPGGCKKSAGHAGFKLLQGYKPRRWHKLAARLLAYMGFVATAVGLSDTLRGLFEWSPMVPRLTLAALVLPGLPIVITLTWYHTHRALHTVSRVEISILVSVLVGAGCALWWVIPSAGLTPLDTSELSLGFVAIRAERLSVLPDATIHGFVSLYLYGNDTPHSAVRLRIAGVGGSPNSVLDLSRSIPAGVGAGGALLEFAAKAIAPMIAVCLTMPHPRLHTLYRVTQTFRVSEQIGNDGIARFSFNRVELDRVTRDDGGRCSP